MTPRLTTLRLFGYTVAIGGVVFALSTAAYGQSDDAVRETMIAESIAAYRGSCACPYSVTADGDPCGNNSAWSRGGGDAPLCFADDITDEMIRDYRDRNG